MSRLFCVLLLVGSVCLGQDVTGSVQGRITDASGAAVPGVRVELTNENTNVASTQQSNEAGNFIFNLIPPGSYTVRASADGFQTAAMTGVLVEVNRASRVNMSLTVGAVTESIEVSAASAQIDAVTAQIATSANTKMITELPSSSRNVLRMAELAPGVSVINGASQVMNITGASASVNGNRQFRNVFYLDGSDNTASFRNTALQFPNPEAVQEMNISTSNTSAEFGKQPGGVFNIITRSGTNELHGSAFYFFTDSALNANTWARNRSGSPREPAELKQGGGTLGGPIVRDKLFFFGSYMYYHDQDAGFQNTIRFPTQAMLNGDFSQFPRQLYDPETRQPLPGNQIPARLMDPVALNLAKLIPTVPNFDDRLNWAFTNPVKNNEVLGKLDYNVNSAHVLALSYFRTFGDQTLENSGGNTNVPAWGPQLNISDQHTGSVRHTWTATPTFLLQTRFAVARHIADRTTANFGRNLSDFGANWPISQEGGRKYLPRLVVSQGFTAHTGFLSLFDQNNYRLASTASWVRNKHNFRFGVEAQRDSVAQFNDHDTAVFNFDGRTSSLGQGQNVFGYAMADFVMGRTSAFSTTGILDYNLSNWAYFFFAQDEWKVLPRLTLTPGLRYEFYSPAMEANNRASAFQYGHQSNLYPNAPQHLAFMGDAGVPNGFTKTDRNNFAPRLGLAYDLFGTGRTVVRGGFGVYYSYNPMQIRMWNAEANPWRPSAAGGEARLVDPWGTSTTVVYDHPPTPFNPDPSIFEYPPSLNNVVGFDPNFSTPYSLQWNVSMAHDFGGKLAVEAAYVGNRGRNLLQMLPGNYPVYGPNATLGNINQRRPIPGYGHVSIIQSRARSWYDALQLSADTRLFKGLTSRFTYVYASAFEINNNDPTGNSNVQTSNPLNLDAEKAPTDAKHVFRAFYVYDLPFLNKADSLTSKILGGWQVAGSVWARSGNALDVTLGDDRNLDGVAGDRPNVTGPIQYASGDKEARANQWLANTSVFTTPAVGTFGNLSRNAVRGPSAWTADLSLLKNFRISEQKRFQARVEGYNIFNHANLGDPNLNMRNSDFNTIITRSGNRTMQVGLRFLF